MKKELSGEVERTDQVLDCGAPVGVTQKTAPLAKRGFDFDEEEIIPLPVPINGRG
ncbi:hypothetical protein J2Z31_002126 [Sinorhizobium kostiense]|uniref:Uncharacterized protein n=1 Tax=Sinorhizobium kostiense TaxID=76747 RepID=A0ABS4QZW0_9HYPH|nr:hypothetical protein [Sinorhizobium kostiense]MBP2235634.1 hypothetical protein [Sinorhizobium kostiense]